MKRRVNILGVEIGIEPDGATEALLDMIRNEWQQRFERLEKQIVYKSGEMAFDEIVDRIPSKPEYRQYKDSLELATLKGTKKRYGVAIHSRRYTRKIRLIDAADTILYIRARRGMSRVDPKASILEQHSPWTVNTIPFMPSKRVATTVSRKVTKREADKVGKLRRRDAKTWKYELSRLGDRFNKKKSRLPVFKKGKATPDTVFEALRMEFGIGKDAAPHWRPGLLSFIKNGPRRLKKYKPFIKAIEDPSYKKWKKWPTKTRAKISLREVHSSKEFVKKLGIRTKMRF